MVLPSHLLLRYHDDACSLHLASSSIKHYWASQSPEFRGADNSLHLYPCKRPIAFHGSCCTLANPSGKQVRVSVIAGTNTEHRVTTGHTANNQEILFSAQQLVGWALGHRLNLFLQSRAINRRYSPARSSMDASLNDSGYGCISGFLLGRTPNS
jgi:hypothetical protein